LGVFLELNLPIYDFIKVGVYPLGEICRSPGIINIPYGRHGSWDSVLPRSRYERYGTVPNLFDYIGVIPGYLQSLSNLVIGKCKIRRL